MPEEPMAPDLVELMQRAADAANARDAAGITSLTMPDGVFDLSPLGLGTYKGRAAIGDFYEEYWATFEDYWLDLEEASNLGGGVTLAVVRQHGRLPGSAARVELRYAAVTTWTAGLAEYTTNYTDTDEARAAAERLAEERR